MAAKSAARAATSSSEITPSACETAGASSCTDGRCGQGCAGRADSRQGGLARSRPAPPAADTAQPDPGAAGSLHLLGGRVDAGQTRDIALGVHLEHLEVLPPAACGTGSTVGGGGGGVHQAPCGDATTAGRCPGARCLHSRAGAPSHVLATLKRTCASRSRKSRWWRWRTR
jgi:hypothetical protein